jgi:hypothetical protein
MRPEERDAALLWDMLDAARAVRDFTVGVTLEVIWPIAGCSSRSSAVS